MDLAPILQTPASLTVLIAPPAWGKTSLLLSLPKPWIFVSPLRALAEELAQRMKDEGHRVRILRARSDEAWKHFCANPNGILIATVETLPEKMPPNIVKRCFFVFDEFHLFLQWGESFRPILREALYSWMSQGVRALALTATLKTHERDELSGWSECALDHVTIVDVGNCQFLHRPKKVDRYSANAFIKRRIWLSALREEGRGMIFCRTRKEVQAWLKWFNYYQIPALGCVGGQVADFQKRLPTKEWSWIVATSALSHGVNLPSFKNVFITYNPLCSSMWLQMAARGGRRGEEFYVHTIDKLSLGEKVRQRLFDVWTRLRLYWHL